MLGFYSDLWVIMGGIMRMILAVTLLLPSLPAIAKPKPNPKIVIQVAAERSEGRGDFQYIYLILPDGSRAEAMCFTLGDACGLQSFAPEKRKLMDCIFPGKKLQAQCFVPESFYATRQANDIVIYGANGGKVYQIVGSWDHFDPGTLPSPPEPEPRKWTAICNDQTLSYSQERSGTCSDHNGVRIWREP
jgi:Protein of unknown function (DUF3761)